jgi:ABC-2 type transport system ATP-binding protein
MTEAAISVRGLRKSYGDIEAVAGIDLAVPRGEVFALLGPNGAGKTTTVEILEGHRQRTAGDVHVLGHDPGRGERAFRERIGIVLQETGVDPYLTVEETVHLYRGYYPDPLAVGDVLEVVGLLDQRSTRVSRLSGGQQRRLDVAVGLAGNPELLFLDEPTTGFDPSARRNAWEMVKNLRSLGKTVFLTTHYMDEAEQLADRVAIITRGRIVAEGAPRALMANGASATISFRASREVEAVAAEVGLSLRKENGQLVLNAESPTKTLFELTRWALARGIELEDLRVTRPSLEDVYLDLVREADRERERP